MDLPEGFAWIPQGTDIASQILATSADDSFVVYYDPDVDGLMAGREVCAVLDAFKKKYAIYINENREHGFFYGNNDSDLEALRGKTVIAVDFSIADATWAKLQEHGVRVINIDHHEIAHKELVTYSFDGKNPDGVIINNQYAFEPEHQRYLSGAGVVYYVFAAMFPAFDNQLMRGLVGITLISDIRPIENEYARVFLHDCYTCRDDFMLYLVSLVKPEKDYGFGVQLMERSYLEYRFNPRFNALFRLNRGYDAIGLLFYKKLDYSLDAAKAEQNNVMHTMIDRQQNIFALTGVLNGVKHPRVKYVQDFVQTAAGLEAVTIPELDNLKISYISHFEVSNEYKTTNFIGLVCSRVREDGKSAVIFMGDSPTHITRGSFRGNSDFVDYLKIFKKHGFTCDGHAGAFGIRDCDISKIDFVQLSQDIADAEAAVTETENFIYEVANMSVAAQSKIVHDIAISNNYVRTYKRVYLRYTGSNVYKKRTPKMIEYLIDGVSVTCFDESYNVENALIMPVYERKTMKFYLRQRKG